MPDVSRSVHQGVGCGLLAGATFAAAQVIAAVTHGDSAMVAVRRSASVLLGPAALTTTPTAIAVIVGLIAHAYLSTMYQTHRARRRAGRCTLDWCTPRGHRR